MGNTPEVFNWDQIESGRGFGSGYSKEELAKYESMYSETLFVVEEKSVVKGIVVDITDRDVVLNIGYKSDGLVALSEFRDLEGLKIGDVVDVYVENQGMETQWDLRQTKPHTILLKSSLHFREIYNLISQNQPITQERPFMKESKDKFLFALLLMSKAK